MNSLFCFVKRKSTALDFVLFAEPYPLLSHPMSDFKDLPSVFFLGAFQVFFFSGLALYFPATSLSTFVSTAVIGTTASYLCVLWEQD